jgi:prevent-host-death family protein
MLYTLHMSQHPRLPATKARAEFAKLLTRVFGGERVVIERAGGVAVAMVPVADLELLEELEDRADVEAARKALAEMEAAGEKPIPWAEAKRRMDAGK